MQKCIQKVIASGGTIEKHFYEDLVCIKYTIKFDIKIKMDCEKYFKVGIEIFGSSAAL